MKINKCPKCSEIATLWKGTVEIYSVYCFGCNWVGGIYTNQRDAINSWNEQEKYKEAEHTVCEGCDDFMGECDGEWSCPGAF